MDNMIDYHKLGLCAGLEIHQQIASSTKLFCNCPVNSVTKDSKNIEFPIEIRRKLRPVASELGEYDTAVLHEFLKDKVFVYRANSEYSCLVEEDNDPPKSINKEALKIVLQACKLLNCDIVDEIQVMRKIVIDGSSVSGFQRTVLIGTNGFIETSFGKLGISSVCLEEDSAPSMQTEKNFVQYRLDRLGIPLIEIATTPDLRTPEHVMEAAQKIGMLLRSLNVVRGIGSIRQDVNVSIKGGNRVEIKGFQELEKISRLVENEVERQSALLEIRQELARRGISTSTSMSIKNDWQNVTELLKNTKNNRIRQEMQNGMVIALKLPRFAGLLKKQCGVRTFGQELADYAKAYGYGIIHSDEDLQKHNLTWEFIQIKNHLKCNEKENDAVLIMAGSSPEKAAHAIFQRINEIFHGVPKETRVADKDGIASRYTRPLPGTARMYPETDIPPVSTNIEVEIPRTLAERESDLMKLELPKELVSQLVKSHEIKLFEELNSEYNEPKLIASTLLSTIKDLRRRGLETDKITKDILHIVFGSIKSNKIPKTALPRFLEAVAKGENYKEAIKKFRSMPYDELKKIVKDVVDSNLDKNEKELMGIVMSRVQSRAEGETIIKVLREIKII